MARVPWSKGWWLSSATFRVLRFGYINHWIKPPIRLLNIDVSAGGLTQWCSVTDRYYVIYRKGNDVWVPCMLNLANIIFVEKKRQLQTSKSQDIRWYVENDVLIIQVRNKYTKRKTKLCPPLQLVNSRNPQHIPKYVWFSIHVALYLHTCS